MSEFECIKLKQFDGVSVVKFTDEKVVDPARIEKMGNEFLSLADNDTCQNLLINFENVRFLSSAAINKLIVLEKRMRAGGRELRLSNLRPEVRDLFSLTNLDRLFKIADQQADAIDSFGGETG